MDDDDISENESIADYESKQSNGSTTNLNEGDKLPLDVTEAIKSLSLVDKVTGNTYVANYKSIFILFLLQHSCGNDLSL